MIRKTALVAFVSLLVAGMSVAALGAAPAATTDAPLAQEENETTTEAPDETTTVEAAEETTAEESENATVTFGNQTSNGSAVVVNETNLPEGGFVVIHLADNVTAESYDDPDNVSVGPVVGNSTYLEAGSQENVTVELNRSIDESQPLVAMPHQDTDDNQSYDFPEADDPYTVDQLPVIDVAFVTLEDGGEMTETEEAAEMTETEEDEDTETTTEDEM